VRDPVAADLLVALVDKDAGDQLALDAVAHQNRIADAPVLDKAAAATSQDALIAEYTRTLAARLRTPDPCR
jgi:hypothetical protein